MESMFHIQQDQGVMFVGLACVDLFNILSQFPTEDQGHRCLDCYWTPGGNASNSATVFSLLGGHAEFFGTLSDDREVNFIGQNFRECNIKFDKCVIIPATSTPLSVVMISQATRTRTILHTNKNLPELTLEHFKDNIDLNTNNIIKWFHFEGRDNVCEIAKMLSYIQNHNDRKRAAEDNYKSLVVSMEAEKLRLAPGLDKYNVWQLPDVMFVSKDFARSQGYNCMTEAVSAYLPKLKKGAVVICPWGEDGAAANSESSGVVCSPAYPPSAVLDTCGAGDTFIAATILSLSRGQSLFEAVTYGCRVAGTKCGIQGFKGLTSEHQLQF